MSSEQSIGIKDSCFTYRIWTLKRQKSPGFFLGYAKSRFDFKHFTNFPHEQEQVTSVIVMQMGVGSSFCI